MAAEPLALDERPGLQIARNPIKRALYLVAGTLSLALGTLGLFIRGFLPTTPFLLLTAYCYGRSSERMYHWIYDHRVFGPILNDWEHHRSLSRRTKTIGIASVWTGILVSITVLHFTVPAAREPYLQAMLVVVATLVTVFLSTRPTAVLGAPRRGLTPRTKAVVLGVLWLGLSLATGILEIRSTGALAPHHWTLAASIGLALTAAIATQPRPVRPPVITNDSPGTFAS